MFSHVEFPSGGEVCHGMYFQPPSCGKEKHGAIALAHGFSAVKEMSLPKYAERFAQRGFAVLAFDYRYFGCSGGTPRGRLHPLEQVEDYQSALAWLEQQPGVDSNRLGAWGTSLSGAHVIHLAAYESRVRCIVSQVPAVDVPTNLQRLMTCDQFERLQQLSRGHRDTLAEHGTIKVVSSEATEACLLPGELSSAVLTRAAVTAPSWSNAVTVDSIDRLLEYRPATVIRRVSPTPLLMIVSGKDTVTPTDMALKVYAEALEPKELLVFDGGHYDAYPGQAHFESCVSRAADWFSKHLHGDRA